MLAALAVVAAYDEETMYHQIVGTVGAGTLVAACEDKSDADWSGLTRYGYWKRRKRPAGKR